MDALQRRDRFWKDFRYVRSIELADCIKQCPGISSVPGHSWAYGIRVVSELTFPLERSQTIAASASFPTASLSINLASRITPHIGVKGSAGAQPPQFCLCRPGACFHNRHQLL